MYNDNQRARGLPMDWPSSAFTSGWIAIIHTLWLFGGFQIVMVPTVIIHFKLECSIINSINHPFGISHIYGNLHILEVHWEGPAKCFEKPHLQQCRMKDPPQPPSSRMMWPISKRKTWYYKYLWIMNCWVLGYIIADLNWMCMMFFFSNNCPLNVRPDRCQQ